MDPSLRVKLDDLLDPTSDAPRVLMVYSLRQAQRIAVEEALRVSAVQSLDDCNAANAQAQLRVDALMKDLKRQGWHVATGGQ